MLQVTSIMDHVAVTFMNMSPVILHQKNGTQWTEAVTLKRKYKKLTLTKIWGQFDPKTCLNLTNIWP